MCLCVCVYVCVCVCACVCSVCVCLVYVHVFAWCVGVFGVCACVCLVCVWCVFGVCAFSRLPPRESVQMQAPGEAERVRPGCNHLQETHTVIPSLSLSLTVSLPLVL